MITLDPSQERAIDVMLDPSQRLAIMTGGPGTGKTTVLRSVLNRLDALGKSYVLCAPTGKAAKRMQETTGRPASTIHALLKLRGSRNWFAPMPRTVVPALPGQYVFVDEASMVDAVLMADLSRATRPGVHRIRLIGDVDQLPPVGPGQPFADFIGSRVFRVVRLDTAHRSREGAWISNNAPRINAGQMPELCAPDIEHGFRFIECALQTDVARAIDHLYSGKLGADWAAKVTGFVTNSAPAPVLSPQRDGAAGVHHANITLANFFVPFELDAPRIDLEGGTALRDGVRVIQTKNDRDRGLVNGDMGMMHYDAEGARITLQLDADSDGDQLRDFSLEQARMTLEVAYALTIHKSQGSEYPWVVVVCHSAHHFLTRRLLYTALTRAKAGVVLIGDRRGLQLAVNNTKEKARKTWLKQRLQERYPTIDGPSDGSTIDGPR
jgi:exodeoxyribonuclease V alpha subunit